MPLEGYKKFIDTINALNRTEPTLTEYRKGIDLKVASIIFGGNAVVENKEKMTMDKVVQTQFEMFSYMREKFRIHGIFNALGDHDVYP